MNYIKNVFVVDDDDAVRDSLRMLLKTAGYRVATLSSADEFLAICNPETEGCLILDVSMPGMDGLALQEELKQRGSRLPIIFLTGQGSIPISVRALKSGALDFLTKPVDGTELIACVEQALKMYSQVRKKAYEIEKIRSMLDTLTEREHEVLLLVSKGFSNKEVADQLGISFRTVENHRAHVMLKTGSSNLIELAQIASYQAPCD
jgi:FixJ family two-component response regulator